jgi:hypothetical protein
MPALAEPLVGFFKQAHERVLVAARGLDEAQLQLRPDGTNSIAWNLWHVARFADLVQFELAAAPSFVERLGWVGQLWEREALAARWGLDPSQLGRWETGWGMPEEIAHAMRLPADELRDYAERATAALGRTLDLIDEAAILGEFASPLSGDVHGYAPFLVRHATHVNRHLGMIECLRGQITGRGSATV